MSQEKRGLAISISELSGMPPMSDCEHYGMSWGCDTECPVLRAGKCEIKDDINKELWLEVQAELDEGEGNEASSI